MAAALRFIHHEATGGIVLMCAAIIALVIANSPAASLYGALLDTHVSIRIGEYGLDKNLLHWINDGLMAIFFFLVGLEIKRELVNGELSSFGQAALPFAAAVGGMIMPALIYLAINDENAVAWRGWAIPTATDIAFAVGVMAVLGKRIPPALKIFLLALAIIDDLGAILIIAIFYTSKLSLASLALAAAGIVLLAALNLTGVKRLAPYVLVGILVWLCVLKSGVHATLAGVVAAFAVPLDLNTSSAKRMGMTSANDLMENLHPWVTFLVLPLFAFANAGVSLKDVGLDTLAGGVPLGIALGLILGKPIGILIFSKIMTATGLAELPQGCRWPHMLGAGCLAGIGFTMSLFIGTLAFPDPSFADDVRLGVLGGSIASAVLGYLILAQLNNRERPAMG
jgi:NhaA family Na+:H+ antiporter